MSDKSAEQIMKERVCPACDRGEKTTTPPHSSIVGSSPVHYPSGHVCMKHIPQAQYDFFMERAARRVEEGRG